MQKITAQNYNKLSSIIPFSKMPKDLADTHAEMPMYLEFYGQDKEINEVVDLYLTKVNQIINKPVVIKKPVAKKVNQEMPVTEVTQKPCKCIGSESPFKEIKEMVKNPFVIGAFITGLVIGKIL